MSDIQAGELIAVVILSIREEIREERFARSSAKEAAVGRGTKWVQLLL